jgi:hypothetical protein
VSGTTGAFPPGFGPAPIPPPPPFGFVPPSGTSGSFLPSAASRAVDVAALSRVALAAVLAIAGQLLGIVIIAFTNVSGLISVTTSSSGARISLPSPWVWVGYVLGGAALALTEIVLLRAAFHGLAPADRTFSSPASLAVVALIGVVLALSGLGLFLKALYDAVACAGTGVPITTSCLTTGTFWGGVALLGIGALLAFIGYIGVLLGIWRLGTRYGDSKFKVGAILLIFPYINLVGGALILVAARAARAKVEGAGSWTSLPH